MPTPNRRHAPAGDDRRMRELAERAERDRTTAAETSRLLARVAAGDRDAGQALFNENLNMVLRTARRRAQSEPPDGLNEDELVQEGSIGLIGAIHAYAGDGAGFAAFAADRVERQMSEAAEARHAVVAGDAQLVADAEAYERAEVSIRKLKGRAPTPQELAQKLEWPLDKANLLGEMVAEARRQHDEELLQYLDPGDVSALDLEDRPGGRDA